MRELYYIPEEEMEEVVRSQDNRRKFGVAQIVIGFILALAFVSTNADAYEPPYWALLFGIVLAVTGFFTLKKFEMINRKYNLKFGN